MHVIAIPLVTMAEGFVSIMRAHDKCEGMPCDCVFATDAEAWAAKNVADLRVLMINRGVSGEGGTSKEEGVLLGWYDTTARKGFKFEAHIVHR